MRSTQAIQAEANQLMAQIGGIRADYKKREAELLARFDMLDGEMRAARDAESPETMRRRIEALEHVTAPLVEKTEK